MTGPVGTPAEPGPGDPLRDDRRDTALDDAPAGRRVITRRTLLGAGLLGAAGLGTGVWLAGRGTTPARPRPRADARPAVGVPADVAHRWVGHHLALVEAHGTPAPAAAEMLAVLGIVLAAAARPGAVVVPGPLEQLRLPGPTSADPALTADAALAWLAPRRYLDAAGPALVAAVTEAEAAIEAAPAASRAPAREAGAAIGAAVLQWYERVMLAPSAEVRPLQPPGPHSWEPTPPDYEQAALPHWGAKPTLTLPEVDVPDDPPAFSTDPGSERYRLAVEVRDTVAALTDDQRAIARHWADGKWSITPPGHWLGIASRALQEREADLDLAAHTLLLLGASQHDAFVSCWASKFRTDVLRPLTYIRRHLGEPQWLSPVPTPCFPEYTSGHATQSGAAATVLAAVLGDTPFTDPPPTGAPARSYPSFTAAAEEAAVSRLYGGIHYRDANEQGLACGRRIGGVVLERYGTG